MGHESIPSEKTEIKCHPSNLELGKMRGVFQYRNNKGERISEINKFK